MFTSILRRHIQRVQPRRGFTMITPPPVDPKTGHRDKTIVESWFSDNGYWPFLTIMFITLPACMSAALYITTNSPDARLNKDDRKKALRGDAAKEDDTTGA